MDAKTVISAHSPPDVRRGTQTRRGGWVLIDLLVAFSIVATLSAVLASMVQRQQRALHQLADIRSAGRLAESTLISLQTATPAPAVSEGRNVRVEDIDGPATPGHRWVRVTATNNGRRAMLTGLVPESSAPGGPDTGPSTRPRERGKP